jgi:hypothetical protein
LLTAYRVTEPDRGEEQQPADIPIEPPVHERKSSILGLCGGGNVG